MKLILLSLLTTLALTANDKVALVIGNKDYTNQTGLKNPINDAKLIGDTLDGMGYDVLEAYNLKLDSLDDKLDDFIAKSQRAKIAVIYYAGHGLGVNGKNYLIPIGTENLSVSRLDKKLTSVNELKEAVSYASNFGVVMFDACRNSFFKKSIRGLSSGRGSRALVQPTVQRANVLVSFSTQAGTIAKDDVGNGKHSPYALALSENLKSNRDIRQVMGSIRERVFALTSNEQYPVDKNLLGGEQYCLSGYCREEFNSKENAKLRAEIARLKEQQNRVVQVPVVIEEKKEEVHSNIGILKIGNLMYQNQPFSTQDKSNYNKGKNGGRVWDWKGAKEYCQDLTHGGYSNWRLPTESELKKLLTKNKNSNSSGYTYYIKKDFVENMPPLNGKDSYAPFWSSREKDSSLAWYVDFNDGFGYWYYKTLQVYALCVR